MVESDWEERVNAAAAVRTVFDVLLVKRAGYETSADTIHHYKLRATDSLAKS